LVWPQLEKSIVLVEPGDERCHPSKNLICKVWHRHKAARRFYLRYTEMQKSAVQGIKQYRLQPCESVGQKPDSKHASKPEKFSGKLSGISTAKDLIQHDLSKTIIMSYSTIRNTPLARGEIILPVFEPSNVHTIRRTVCAYAVAQATTCAEAVKGITSPMV